MLVPGHLSNSVSNGVNEAGNALLALDEGGEQRELSPESIAGTLSSPGAEGIAECRSRAGSGLPKAM